MLKVNLMATVVITERDEWEAEIYAEQSKEWLKRCPNRQRCPCARLFRSIIALKQKSDRQAWLIKHRENWPNEP